MPTVPSLSVPAIDAKPFYAYVGAGDAAIASLRARVIGLPETLKTVPGQISAQVASLPTLAQTLPVQAKELQAKLLKQREDFAGNVEKLEKLYADFATRGERVLSELRGGKAKATSTPVTKPASKPAAKPAAKKTPAATPTATADVPAQSLNGTSTPSSSTPSTTTPTS